MPRIRRKLPRIFAPLLVALSISCLHAPQARAAQTASPAPPAQKSPLDAPAREFARRIAASLPGGTRVQIEVRNQSSLSEEDASVLRTTMAGELSARGLRTSGEGPGVASVTITLSENVQSYVWVAQIQHGDDSSVLLQSVPRETPATTAPEAKKIVLRKELLWSGPAHVLDATELPASGDAPASLLLLELDGTTAVLTDSQNSFRTELPVAISNPRDTNADLELADDDMEVTLPDNRQANFCKVALDHHAAPECEFAADLIVFIRAIPPPSSGDQATLASSPCDGADIVLATSKADYTQPDTIVALEESGPQRELSGPLAFPGPVLRFGGVPGVSVIAVARNLKNGNYEVYRITAACGQ